MSKSLNEKMDFWSGVEVLEDGSVVQGADTPSFELYMRLDDNGVWVDDFQMPEGWALMTGYSGQDSYNGPVMHPSEYIGGGMERDILATPGVYVCLVVECDCGYTEEFCTEDVGCDCEAAGWVVAYKHTD